MTTKSILVIVRHPPYGNNAAREALDAALTCAIFEQDVSLLFLSDSVYQLLPNHDTNLIGQKNLAANIQVLPMYDIDKLYVCEQALTQRGLKPNDLAVDAAVLAPQETAHLLQQADVVLTF